MDDLALDRELDMKADEALQRMEGNVQGATTLLLRWIEQGTAGVGIAERVLNDYISALVAERAR